MAAFTQGQENSISTYNGNFKEIYADDIVSLIPKQFKLQKLIKLEMGDMKLGNYYHQPVIVQDEQGVTYSNPEDGAYDLNAAVPGQTRDSVVRDSSILVRTALAYDVLDRAAEKGKRAFKAATELAVQSMIDCLSKRVEIALIYGRSKNGLGRIAVAGDAIAGTNAAGTEYATVIASSGTPTSAQVESSITSSVDVKIFLKKGQWAPGIWAGAKNAKVQIYLQTEDGDGDTITVGTSISAAGFSVKSVNFSEKSLVLTGISADATALLALVDAGTACHIKYLGSAKKEMIGLERIVSNSGSLFGIDATVYDLWQGNHLQATGDISNTKVFKGVNTIVERGGEEEYVLFGSTRIWNAIMASDMAAKRQVDASYSNETHKIGSKDVKFFHALGDLDLMGSLYVKEEQLFILCVKTFKRLGTAPINFGGRGKDEYFLQLPNNAGVELRARTSQCLHCHAPLKNGLMDGVTFVAGY